MPESDWTDHVFAVPLPGKRWGAIQILASDEKTGLTATGLEGIWETVPTISDALLRGALQTRTGLCLVHCSEEQPLRRFVDLGTGKPCLDRQPVRSYGSLYGFALWLELERQWRSELTTDERAR